MTLYAFGHDKGQKQEECDRSRRDEGRVSENTQKNKKCLNNHDGVITHLEPGILECEVKWALRSITKASRGEEISTELFKILKDGAVKALHSICQESWKTQQCPQNWKRSVFI